MYTGEDARDPMMTLTLTRGEGENSLAASGTHYQGEFHKTFTVTGKSSTPEEDGKIPVELDFIYTEFWPDVELEGKFDPEEESLRGTLKLYSGVITGDFVFKRSPDFVRFYPPPSITTARKRWEFATKAVLDKIRRNSWSPTYLLQRIKDGKRYMDITIRMRYYGRVTDADDEEEYNRLFTTMLAGDAQFYAALITVKLATVVLQYVQNEPCALNPPLTSTSDIATLGATPAKAVWLTQEFFAWTASIGPPSTSVRNPNASTLPPCPGSSRIWRRHTHLTIGCSKFTAFSSLEMSGERSRAPGTLWR